MATEIDLPWTYVGGSADLIERILDDGRIEALPAEPADPLSHVEAWVSAWADEATTQLLSGGDTVISTSRGTVHAWLGRPSRFRRGMLRTSTVGDNGFSGSGEQELRDEISLYLTSAVIGLVGR